MKSTVTALLVLISLFCQGQDIVVLNDPLDSYQLFNDGWHYKMGEFPGSVRADFVEDGWKRISPGADIHDSIPGDAKAGIGWMRLLFRVSPEARGQQFSMMIHQLIASEIYFNGQIIKRYGNISEVPPKIKATDPLYEPFALSFSNDSIQVLAVRFAVQPGIKYAMYYGVTNPFFSARLMRNDNAISKYREIYIRPWLDLFMQGILFMVFVVHISFFLMYREQRANLLFALAALVNVMGSQIHNYYYYHATPDLKFSLAVLVSILYSVVNLLMFVSVQIYLKVQKNVSFRILAAIHVVSILSGALWYKNGFYMMLGFVPIISYLFIIILSLNALKRQVREAGILVIGFSIAILSFILFIGNGIRNPGDHILTAPFNLYSFFFLLYVLAPPASVSIFLAYDFARTSNRLRQKLDEVEILSEKNGKAEREKREILASQNQQLEIKVEERTAELNRSLSELKSTQAQLIQSEKMASLGELTAGIAHEIQNPLNFVNNFSEVNTELIGELKKEISEENYPVVKTIADDLEVNMAKITEHGKRADSIVKSMLLHSRTSNNQRDMTDINALVDEYVRMAYHGMRAKDKSFNAKLITNYDPGAESIEVIPQDIGRVLLNLFNNAFYAVDEKQKSGPGDYRPTITVETRKQNGLVEIQVMDNGYGIPEKNRDKIFQPFFTTKPAGQGTGLGLSLAYDIIRAHRGELKVFSTDGEGTTFVIQIPA